MGKPRTALASGWSLKTYMNNSVIRVSKATYLQLKSKASNGESPDQTARAIVIDAMEGKSNIVIATKLNALADLLESGIPEHHAVDFLRATAKQITNNTKA